MCPYNQKLILPLSVDETLTRNIYRKDPHKEKEIVLGQTTKGVSKLIQTGGALNEVLKDVFQDIDIYDEDLLTALGEKSLRNVFSTHCVK